MSDEPLNLNDYLSAVSVWNAAEDENERAALLTAFRESVVTSPGRVEVLAPERYAEDDAAPPVPGLPDEPEPEGMTDEDRRKVASIFAGAPIEPGTQTYDRTRGVWRRY